MNSDSLFDRIRTAAPSESIRDIFSSLNLDGYKFIDELTYSDEVKDKIVRYVVFAYSYQSALIRKSKDRKENKKTILKKVGLDINDDYVKKIFVNRNDSVNHFITWWFLETQHPLWQTYLSAIDTASELFEFSRSGLEIEYTGDAKGLKAFMKQMKADIKLKGEAHMLARKISSEAAVDLRELEAMYELPEKIINDEVPMTFEGSRNMAEFLAKKYRNKHENNRRKPQDYTAIQEG